MISEYRCRQAWQAGKKAFEAGKPLSANNRERGTFYYDDWWDGGDLLYYSNRNSLCTWRLDLLTMTLPDTMQDGDRYE